MKDFSYKKDLHIGHLIQQELSRQGRSASWLAKSIYCERSNIYKLFQRESISIDQLMRISEVMEHDFLRDCYNNVD
ncbi:MAG: XRE family transcriptional regulator [Bacteroidales bacterium]|nr:XRE family transcriptional regulator [Bacteroidales bacterium]